MIAKKLTDLIGNTPLLEFSNFNASKGLKAKVIGKLEYFNPAGSVKDRIALAMIEDAEEKGLLKPGATIIARYGRKSRYLRRRSRNGRYGKRRWQRTESAQSGCQNRSCRTDRLGCALRR